MNKNNRRRKGCKRMSFLISLFLIIGLSQTTLFFSVDGDILLDENNNAKNVTIKENGVIYHYNNKGELISSINETDINKSKENLDDYFEEQIAVMLEYYPKYYDYYQDLCKNESTILHRYQLLKEYMRKNGDLFTYTHIKMKENHLFQYSPQSLLSTDGTVLVPPLQDFGIGGVDRGDHPLQYSAAPFGERYESPKTHELLFEDDFSDRTMTDWMPDEEDGGDPDGGKHSSDDADIGIVPTQGYDWVFSASLDDENGGAWAYSRSAFSNGFDYTVQVKFWISTAYNHWIPAIYNNEIWIGIDGGQGPGDELVYYSMQNNPPATHIMNLDTETWYYIQAHFKYSSQTYDIYVWEFGDDLPTAPIISDAEEMSLGAIPFQYLVIGDPETGCSNYGYGIYYDDIMLWGYSYERYHENFDDQSLIDWDIHTSQNGNMRISSNRLEMSSPATWDMAYGNTPYIDYNSRSTVLVDGDYHISTFFMVDDDTPTPNWFRIIQNKQVEVALNYYNNEDYISVYERIGQNPVGTNLFEIEREIWYHIQVDIDVSNNDYKLQIDGETIYDTINNKNHYHFLENDAFDYINLGDISTSLSKGHVYWDHIKLWGPIYNGQDQDWDRMSNHFEGHTYTLIYSDSLESKKWINPWVRWNNPLGAWQGNPPLTPPNGWGWQNSDWEQGTPSSGVFSGHANSLQVYKTNLDGGYRNSQLQVLYTPKIIAEFTNTITISWYQTYKFQTLNNGAINCDGGKIFLYTGFDTTGLLEDGAEYYDPAEWRDIGGSIYNGVINPGFGNPLNGDALVGTHEPWYKVTISNIDIAANHPNKRAIVIGFFFGTDNRASEDYGWIIDDLKVYATSNVNNRDTDGDNSWDSDEFYTYDTSPISPDTDADGTPDLTEIQSTLFDYSPLYQNLHIEWYDIIGCEPDPAVRLAVHNYYESMNIDVQIDYYSVSKAYLDQIIESINGVDDADILDSEEREEIHDTLHGYQYTLFVFFGDYIESGGNLVAGVNGPSPFIAAEWIHDWIVTFRNLFNPPWGFEWGTDPEQMLYVGHLKYALHEIGHALNFGEFDDFNNNDNPEIYSGSNEPGRTDVTSPGNHPIVIGTVFGFDYTITTDEWPVMSRPTQNVDILIAVFSHTPSYEVNEEYNSSWLAVKSGSSSALYP